MTYLLSQTWFIALMSITLIGAVLSTVHHAEVIAHKTGEPYDTLVLSISVTVIEVSLIIAMMLAGHEGSEYIARDAVFATAMIIINGVVGLCIFMGGQNIMRCHFATRVRILPWGYSQQWPPSFW
jgi:Ca2+:H+ antiporter